MKIAWALSIDWSSAVEIWENETFLLVFHSLKMDSDFGGGNFGLEQNFKHEKIAMFFIVTTPNRRKVHLNTFLIGFHSIKMELYFLRQRFWPFARLE